MNIQNKVECQTTINNMAAVDSSLKRKDKVAKLIAELEPIVNSGPTNILDVLHCAFERLGDK